MPGTRKKSDLGLLLKDLLEERSMSMRNLSVLTGIDTATISRISSGKRNATIQHLQKFGETLEVPIVRLIKAAGYPIEQEKLTPNTEIAADAIQSIIKKSNLIDDNFSTSHVEEQLSTYVNISQTEEGCKTILEGFEEKVLEVNSIGPFISDLRVLFERFKLRKGTLHELAIIGGALLYFIMPIDVIPDYLFAVGYLDDVIAVQFAMNTLPHNREIII